MKINSSVSMLFWLYTQKTDDSGKAPIYCRIMLGGIRTQFSTGKKLNLNIGFPRCPKQIRNRLMQMISMKILIVSAVSCAGFTISLQQHTITSPVR